MDDAREEDPFLVFRARPSAEALLEVLRRHQDQAYTVAFQVLRSREDAEDAAQEVLLEIARAAARLSHPRYFKTWLYRVALRTAINHREARARRADLVRRKAAMAEPDNEPLSKDDRGALMNALDRLDDPARCLVLEHYFEKATLDELARREGVSSVAVWKRLQRALDRLRRFLAAAGFGLLAARAAEALETMKPVAAPAGLLGGKVASTAALVAAGGIAMGTKIFVPAAVLVVLLSVGIGGVAGYRMAARRPETPDRTRALEAEVAQLKDLLAARAPVPPETTHPAPAAPETARATLSRLLKKYRALVDAHAARRKAWAAEHPGQGYPPEEYGRQLDEIASRLPGIREAILEDPPPFLEFLADPANEPYVWDLFNVTLVARRGGNMIAQQTYGDFPAALMEGLLALLESGSPAVRSSALDFLTNLSGQPQEARELYVRLLADPGKGAVGSAVRALSNFPDLTPEEVSAISRVAETGADLRVRSQAVWAMGWTRSPAGNQWLLTSLETGREPALDAHLAMAIDLRLRQEPGEAFENGAARAFGAAIARTTDEATTFRLLTSAGRLPLARAKPLFAQAATQGGTMKTRSVAAEVVRRLDAGEDRSAIVNFIVASERK